MRNMLASLNDATIRNITTSILSQSNYLRHRELVQEQRAACSPVISLLPDENKDLNQKKLSHNGQTKGHKICYQ